MLPYHSSLYIPLHSHSSCESWMQRPSSSSENLCDILMVPLIYTFSPDLQLEECIVFEQPSIPSLRIGFISHCFASLPSIAIAKRLTCNWWTSLVVEPEYLRLINLLLCLYFEERLWASHGFLFILCVMLCSLLPQKNLTNPYCFLFFRYSHSFISEKQWRRSQCRFSPFPRCEYRILESE